MRESLGAVSFPHFMTREKKTKCQRGLNCSIFPSGNCLRSSSPILVMIGEETGPQMTDGWGGAGTHLISNLIWFQYFMLEEKIPRIIKLGEQNVARWQFRNVEVLYLWVVNPAFNCRWGQNWVICATNTWMLTISHSRSFPAPEVSWVHCSVCHLEQDAMGTECKER